jgi:hypothetical protein
MAIATSSPTFTGGVRGAAHLLTAGRRGNEPVLAVSAGLLVDAALAGVIDVTGRRLLGIDLRRVVPGPSAGREPLLADLRRRVAAAAPDTPMGWIERAAVFAPAAVAEEEPEGDPVPRLRGLLTGEHYTAEVAALAAVLVETELIMGVVGRRALGWRAERALKRSRASLPPAARAVVSTLEENRRAAERIGTWYADD